MNQVTDTEKFLFDIQGYLILPGAIDGDLIDALDCAVVRNEAFDHDESWADGLPVVTAQHFIKDNNIEHQVRLNGLPRLDHDVCLNMLVLKKCHYERSGCTGYH